MIERIHICSDIRCTGCAACFNICRHKAISLISDDEGFLRPQINSERCINCGLCQKVCPENNFVKRNEQPLAVYSGWSKDEQIRLNSASGGAFAEIARFFIEHYNAAVFGVTMNKNLDAVHICVESLKELPKLQGSKYIQSKISDAYRQAEKFLRENRYVLFSGTSCQIAGLKNYLRKDYSRLYTIDLICHGVPSKRVFDDYIKYIGKSLNHPVYDIRFRCKKDSWIFFNMAANSYFEKGFSKLKYEYEGAYFKDPFIRAFLRDNILRPSCYQCQYTSVNRVADYTLADWWGYRKINKIDKGFEQKGVSLVLCNNFKGQSIINKFNLELRERTIEEAIKTNSSLINPFKMPVERVIFWQDYNNMPFEEIVKKWFSPEKLSPSLYVLYTMKPSLFRRVLYKIFFIYEKFSRMAHVNIIKIKA